MELFIAALDNEGKRCFFDVSVTDINTSPKFTTNEKITANFLERGSCLHLRGSDKFLLMDDLKSQTAVYYPTEKRVKFLPSSAIRLPRPRRRGFTTSATFKCTGFGKEWQTGDFRVIRNVIIWHHDSSHCYAGSERRFEIYSMKTDKWREMKVDALPASAHLMGSGSILIGDVYYWIATGLQVEGGWGIVGFNFTSEEFLIWGFSPQVDKKHCLYLINLGDDNETLGLISYANPCYPVREFVIWAVRGGGEGGFEQRHAFTIPQPVASPVGFIGGRLLFLDQKLTKDPKDPRYRLNVFDVFKRTLMPLDFYTHNGKMQVISYEVGKARLPGAKPLSECNSESYWNAHKLRNFSEPSHLRGGGSGGSHGKPSRPRGGGSDGSHGEPSRPRGGGGGNGDGDGDGGSDGDGDGDGDGF